MALKSIIKIAKHKIISDKANAIAESKREKGKNAFLQYINQTFS